MTDAPKRIDRFTGEYAFLSNFFPSEVCIRDIDGKTIIRCATVEHGFQAAKTMDPLLRTVIAHSATPQDAKRQGRWVKLRPNWETIKEGMMTGLLRQKFAPGSELAERLLATGNAELIEGNRHGDTYWGTVDGEGLNRLGVLLMQRRIELRNETKGRN